MKYVILTLVMVLTSMGCTQVKYAKIQVTMTLNDKIAASHTFNSLIITKMNGNLFIPTWSKNFCYTNPNYSGGKQEDITLNQNGAFINLYPLIYYVKRNKIKYKVKIEVLEIITSYKPQWIDENSGSIPGAPTKLNKRW